MLGLYVLGFVAALVTARLLKSSILKASSAPFILELPQYRLPTLRSLGLRLLDRGRCFYEQAGTVILASRWCSGCWGMFRCMPERSRSWPTASLASWDSSSSR